MKKDEIRIAILRIEGTNCEEESYNAFKILGTKPEYVHVNELSRGLKKLNDYQMIFIPGGFSGGDYVRAGAIFASRMKGTISMDLKKFIDDGKLVIGVCNGFQVLIELGFLPGINTDWSEKPQAALAPNISNRFECRWIYVKKEKNSCEFLKNIDDGKIIALPIAHAEGRFIFSKENEKKYLEHMIDNNQIALRYVDPNGNYEEYPWNPNGSLYNIAGICNENGNVFGLMPHPERAFSRYQHPGFYRNLYEEPGKKIFKGMVDYIVKKF
ncbi:MAG: phosphoribosylformylglycinamidine synthase subunit PurQ [Thermoplasmata archaeon]|nr:phosphoribosylformylglycinamidine synthase subunit PurQ [Thermoplasmata archaeon]